MNRLTPAAWAAAGSLTLLALATLWLVPIDVIYATLDKPTITLWLRARFGWMMLACCGAALIPGVVGGHLAGRHPAEDQTIILAGMLATAALGYILSACFAY
ncbi:MAG: hypothetical protein KGL39_40270 [Patescibacteria group bacterium]|nr:hypothetical protein [Patescibacteria group bacterium]